MLMVVKLVKKLAVFYGIRKFTAVTTKANHCKYPVHNLNLVLAKPSRQMCLYLNIPNRILHSSPMRSINSGHFIFQMKYFDF
jgi:hypothetical protein